MTNQRYAHNGLAGCVQQRRARQTRTLVGVYHGEQAGMEPDSESPWIMRRQRPDPSLRLCERLLQPVADRRVRARFVRCSASLAGWKRWQRHDRPSHRSRTRHARHCRTVA